MKEQEDHGGNVDILNKSDPASVAFTRVEASDNSFH